MNTNKTNCIKEVRSTYDQLKKEILVMSNKGTSQIDFFSWLIKGESNRKIQDLLIGNLTQNYSLNDEEFKEVMKLTHDSHIELMQYFDNTLDKI